MAKRLCDADTGALERRPDLKVDEGAALFRTAVIAGEQSVDRLDERVFVAHDVGRAAFGQWLEMAVKEGRKSRPDLEVGICGEHGGEPSSVEFCYRVGMNYVSCSPYRVPIARLAAAQAAITGGDKSEAARTA